MQALNCRLRKWSWHCPVVSTVVDLCGTLGVNKTDCGQEGIGSHVSGIWNGSSIGLDLGKLHGQVEIMEHSRLDFTAAGVTSDFSHTFFNFIKKNILSTIFIYASVAALILLLILILPCIVKILQQSTQKPAAELHLAVLKTKKGGDAGSQHGRSHP